MRHDENINQLLEATAYDRDGDKIGGVSGVYLDDQTGEPMWVTVNTGFFGLSSSFAPLAGSSLDGDRLTLAADKDAVKDAPNVDEDGHITRQQEDELYRYYQVDTASVEGDRMRTRRWDRDHDDLRDDDMLDKDRDGRGPVGEVLDGPDRGGPLDRDADGRGPVGEVLDGPESDYDDRDERAKHRADDPMFDKDRDGRGPVGEVLDGPDRGGALDRDADGRGPVGEVLDGPDGDRDAGLLEDDRRDRRDDLEGDPAYRNDPAYIQDQAAQGDERYVDNERLLDERHDEPGLAGDYTEGDLSGRPDAADGPLGERRRGANPIDDIFDAPDQGNPRNV